jgi:aminoglycoside phosphotransferase (APT) family kinase protein
MPITTPGAPPPAEFAIDAGLVQRLLNDQRYELAALPLQVAAEGWDNVTFRLGGDLAVRVPRRRIAADLVVNEQRWLPRLAPALTLRVPAPIHNGVPTDYFPWPWSVVPWIPGTSAMETPLLDSEAERLGRFLGELHTIRIPGDAPHNPYRGVPLRARRAGTLDRLERLRAASGEIHDLGQLIDRLELSTTTPIDTPPVWLHGDLHAKNVISAQGRIAAIIDWGDICVGDPATDLAAIWNLFEPQTHAGFWEAYGDPSLSTRLRASAWAITFGLMLWDSHHVADPAFAELGLTTLQRVVATGV